MSEGTLIPFHRRLTALEFFAGIGLARAGMDAAGVSTIWANDIDDLKCRMYRAQWGGTHLVQADVHSLSARDLPQADIAWASSPCTDLSLAGRRDGLVRGVESSAFFGFARIIEDLGERRPRALVLENVTGLASSHDGEDFRTVVEVFNRLGYSVDALELDARRWLPQSRPRMFVIGLANPVVGGELSSSLRPDRLGWIHADARLMTHVSPLPVAPALRGDGLTKLVCSADDEATAFWDDARVAAFVGSLSTVQRRRLDALVGGATTAVRTAYRRTRAGRPVWEIRDDDIAGCLRTARGGSSRQAVLVAGAGRLRLRWMTGGEYARLQGAEGFRLEGFSDPQLRYAFGDAVAVPAVAWLMRGVIVPALAAPTVEVRHVLGG